MFDNRPLEERIATGHIDHPDPKVRYKQYAFARMNHDRQFAMSRWTPEQNERYHAGLVKRIERIEASDPDFKEHYERTKDYPVTVYPPSVAHPPKTEPEVAFCTIRDAIDANEVESIHLECRFEDGQKFAAVEVAGGYDKLAHKLAHKLADFLNEKRDDAAYRLALAKCILRYEAMAEEPTLKAFVAEFIAGVSTLPLNKLNRWLGYIQGTLIAAGLTTVEAERDWTRPLFRPLDF